MMAGRGKCTYLFTFGSKDRALSPSDVLMCHPTYNDDVVGPGAVPALFHGLWAPKLATIAALRIPEAYGKEE